MKKEKDLKIIRNKKKGPPRGKPFFEFIDECLS